MSALAGISALVTALCIGYHFGRRAASSPSKRRKRLRRAALGGLALSLVLLTITGRAQHNMLTERVLTRAIGGWKLRFVEPFQLFGGNVPRRRLR